MIWINQVIYNFLNCCSATKSWVSLFVSQEILQIQNCFYIFGTNLCHINLLFIFTQIITYKYLFDKK